MSQLDEICLLLRQKASEQLEVARLELRCAWLAAQNWRLKLRISRLEKRNAKLRQKIRARGEKPCV